ncbi:MAG: DNA-binding protein [Promethearchaeota archaeon]
MSQDADDLKRIRERKMQALREEQVRQQALRLETEERIKQRETEREKIIEALFLPDAVVYLKELKLTKAALAERIEDLAIALYLRGQLINRIPKTGVILVQRKLEGVEPKITVKRRGEDEVSFYEAVKKDLAKDS